MDYKSRHILIIGTITSYGLLYAQRIESETDNWSLSGRTSAAILLYTHGEISAVAMVTVLHRYPNFDRSKKLHPSAKLMLSLYSRLSVAMNVCSCKNMHLSCMSGGQM